MYAQSMHIRQLLRSTSPVILRLPGHQPGYAAAGVRLQFGRPARAVGQVSVECNLHLTARELQCTCSCAQSSVLLQAYSLRQGRPVSDADYAPGRTPTNSPTLGNSRSNQTSTQEVDVQELTQQLKIPLYKQLIGNTAMVDLSSLSANPQVCSCS